MENSQTNIVNIITQTINSLFSGLFSSIDNSLYSALDDLLFISSNILDDTYLIKMFGNSGSNGIILICNSLLIGITLYYSCVFMLSHFTFSQVQKPSQFLFKLFVITVSINFSYFFIEKFIELFSNISLAIRSVGESIYDENICISSLIQKFNSIIYFENSDINIFSLNGLIKAIVSIGFLNLSLSYGIRYIIVKVFILFTPFALISLINTNTSWIFKSWIKLLSSMLSLQLLVSLILLVSFSIEYNNSDIFSKIIYISSIYSLIKANSFVRDFMGGISTDVNIGISNIKSLISK